MHSLLFSTTHYRFWMIRFTRIGLAKAATKEGETGLHLVAISGKAGIARALLDAGASPNVRTTFDGVSNHCCDLPYGDSNTLRFWCSTGI